MDYRPWRMLTQALAMFSLINLIIVKLCIFESPKYYFASGSGVKGLEILKKIYAKNTGNYPDQYIVSTFLSRLLSTAELIVINNEIA